MVTLVYGRSDDLIEVDGAVSEELYANYDEPTDIVFNDGTRLRVTYNSEGEWEIDTVDVEDKTKVEILPVGTIGLLSEYSEVAVIQRYWKPKLESVQKADETE